MFFLLKMAAGIDSMTIALCLIAFVSGECFDSITYSGTLNKTVDGYTCQNWDTQYPHTHNRNTPNYFPNDDSVLDARNYCRDAGGTYELWCYTMDTFKRWDYCVSQEETCQAQEINSTKCFDIPRNTDSTFCPNETLFYLCSYKHAEGYTLVNILFDLACFEFSCCMANSYTTSVEQTLSTSLPRTSQTIDDTFSNSSINDQETSTPLSNCKSWISNFSIHVLIFIITMVLLK